MLVYSKSKIHSPDCMVSYHDNICWNIFLYLGCIGSLSNLAIRLTQWYRYNQKHRVSEFLIQYHWHNLLHYESHLVTIIQTVLLDESGSSNSLWLQLYQFTHFTLALCYKSQCICSTKRRRKNVWQIEQICNFLGVIFWLEL